MPNLLLFGLGYSGARIKAALEEEGWTVTGIRRQAAGDVIGFDDAASVRAAIAAATHILSSVPPAEGADPVLALYVGARRPAPARCNGDLQGTVVHGDTGDRTRVVEGNRVSGGVSSVGRSIIKQKTH